MLELVVAVALGEEAVVADAMKVVGQHMQQEAANELMRAQAHDAAPCAAAAVLVGEGDLVTGDGEEPRIADCSAMGVAGEIGEYSGRPAKRRLGVDDPFALP